MSTSRRAGAAAAGLFVDPDPGPVLANFGLEHLRFVQPVYPGDSIKLRLTAKHKTERPGSGWGEVTWDVEVTNQNEEVGPLVILPVVK
jgi:oxepin-CoA hydrolase/3-oxo-5,6-dehydrosuberyl-CoA semialdehyde dehydrogenase